MAEEDLGGGYNAGSVYVSIEPEVDPFFAGFDVIAAKVAQTDCIPVKVCPDERHFLRSLSNLRNNVRIDCIPVKLCLDEDELQQDIRDARKSAADYFGQNPIKIGFDTSALQFVRGEIASLQEQKLNLEATFDLSGARAELGALRAELDAIEGQSRKIYYGREVSSSGILDKTPIGNAVQSVQGLGDAISPEIKRAFKDVAKDLRKGDFLGAIGGIATAPLKILGGLASQAIGGAIFGVGQQLTGGFAKGLTASVGGKLEGSIGSLELLGEKTGDALEILAKNTSKAAFQKLGQVNESINKYIAEVAPEFKTLKSELDEAVVLGVQDYFDLLEDVFPRADRIAEAAAQRARIQKRKQSTVRIAQPQVAQENQAELRALAQQQADINQRLAATNYRRSLTVDVTRQERRELGGQLRATIESRTSPSQREQVLKNAALEIPNKYQNELALVRQNYQEALNAVNVKTEEIAAIEARAAKEGTQVEPVIKKQRQQDLEKLVETAKKREQQVLTVENGIKAEVDRYINAADTGVGAESLLTNLENELKAQIKLVGEPLRVIDQQRKEFQRELEDIKSRRIDLTNKFKSISNPELQRQAIESTIGRSQSKLQTVSSDLETAQNRLGSIQANPTDQNINEVDFLQNSIKSLSTQKISLENKIQKERSKLEKLPELVSKPIQDMFDAVLGASVPLEKLPLVLVDEVRTIQSNADALYNGLENIIVINKATAEQIKSGQLTGRNLEGLLEEISHSLQFDFGSSRGLEKLFTKRGDSLEAFNKVSIPTKSETAYFAKELENYPQRVRQVELEAKVNAQRKRKEIEDARQAQSLSSELEQVTGFAGNKFSQYAQTNFNKARKRLSGVQELSEQIEVDLSESISVVGQAINKLEVDIQSTLEEIANASIRPVSKAEIESLRETYKQRLEQFSEIDKAISVTINDLKEQFEAQKSKKAEQAASQIVPRESSGIASTDSPQTVGGALESITSNFIIPNAKKAGDGLLALAKVTYKASKGLELGTFSLLGPIGIALREPLKAGIQSGVKNVGLPFAAFGLAASTPALGAGISAAQGLVGQGAGALAGLGGAQVGGAIANQLISSLGLDQLAGLGQSISGIPLVGELGKALASLPTEFTGKIVEATTGAFSGAGSAIATAATTIFGGNLIIDGAKKGLTKAATGVKQLGAGVAASDSVQLALNTPVRLDLPSLEPIEIFAEKAQQATKYAIDSVAEVYREVEKTAQTVIDVTGSENVIEGIGKIANHAVNTAKASVLRSIDDAIDDIEKQIRGLNLIGQQIPGVNSLAELSIEQLENIREQIKSKVKIKETAISNLGDNQADTGFVAALQGNIKRLNEAISLKEEQAALRLKRSAEAASAQTIDAKAEAAPQTPKAQVKTTISKQNYDEYLRKLLQNEAKQISELRNQLIEELNLGNVSGAIKASEQLKGVSQSGLEKLESFRNSPEFDLDPAINKSLNAYIGKFRDTIKHAEDSIQKISTNDELGELLSIDTRAIAEKFVGLINTLFEVEAKNLQEALQKAATSPRGKDLIVNTAGFAASQVGAQYGAVPQLAGDLGGALAARQAINIGEQALAARSELLGTEAYEAASALEKLQAITKLTVQKLGQLDIQKALGTNLAQDIAGFSIGNLAATAGNQGLGAVTGGVQIPGLGAIAAGATVPKLSEIRALLNERISQFTQGGEEEGTFRSASGPLYGRKDVEVLKELQDQLNEIDRLTKSIEAGQKRIRDIEETIGKTEADNRRNLRFETVNQDRNRRAAAQNLETLKREQGQGNELSQYLTRVPGTFPASGGGGGRGPRPPGTPTLFIPPIEPRITAFGVAQKAASGLFDVVNKIPKPIKDIFFLLGGGFVGFQAFQLIQQQATAAYEAIKKLETAKVVIKFATGDLTALAEAEKQSDRLGTRLNESRNAIKSLSIQSKNTPLQDDVTSVFKGASTGVAALQLNPEEQQRAFLAFNQIAGKGTVQAEELRQQLGELGFSFTLAARAAGVTTQEFNKQLEQGAVLSQEFLPKYARQLQLELGGAAIAAGDSLQGLENKATNSAQKLQEAFGARALPVVSTGLKLLGGTLEFAANNIQTLTTLINAGLLLALAKGATELTKFAFARQRFQEFDTAGNLVGVTTSSRAGRATTGAIDFIKQGGIQKALQSELAKEIGNVAVQAGIATAAIGTFQTLAESFTGGEALQSYNKQLEITRKRLEDINAVTNKDPKNKQGIIDDFVAGAVGDLLSLNVAGFQKNIANAFSERFGNDTAKTFSDAPIVTAEQSSNSRALVKALETSNSGGFNAAFSKGIGLAEQLKKNIVVDPEILQKSKEELQTYKEQFEALPEALRKTSEGKVIQANIDQLEKLIKTLGGTGSAYTKLTKDIAEFNDITKLQIELQQLQSTAIGAKSRASGSINEFDFKNLDIEAQATALKRTRDSLKQQIEQSDAFLQSATFQALNTQGGDPAAARAIRKENISLKTQYAQADKQIDDLITQQRLDAINRRAELLQREAADQERGQNRIEAIRKVRTTGRDAGLSESLADRTITPQSLRIQQSVNAGADAQDVIVEQLKRRKDALKNLKQAQSDLDAINPNDEQQYEQAKQTVAQYQQAVLGADAEINNQRKAIAESTIQYRNEIEDQIRQQIDLTVRKVELGLTSQEKATERLANAEKRRTDAAVAGYQKVQKFIDLQISALDRAAKLQDKGFQLRTAQSQGALGSAEAGVNKAQSISTLVQKGNQLSQQQEQNRIDRNPGNEAQQKAREEARKADEAFITTQRLRRTVSLLSRLTADTPSARGAGDFSSSSPQAGRNREAIAFRLEVDQAEKVARIKADILAAEIEQSKVALANEQRKEEFASKRAILEAQITEQQARQAALAATTERQKAASDLQRSQVGVAKAATQLEIAQQSGDPLKVKEAQLNLQDAQLAVSSAQDTLLGAQQTEALAKDALPQATLSVVDALANFADTIKGGQLSRRILDVQNRNKVQGFAAEEAGRKRGLAIEGIDKGVDVGLGSSATARLLSREITQGFTQNKTGIQTYAPDLRKLDPTFRATPSAGAIAPIDSTKILGGDIMQAFDAQLQTLQQMLNLNPILDMFNRLINVEETLSAQILSLASRDRVSKTDNHYYGVDPDPLRGTPL